MKQLIIVRHAKSSWDIATLNDFDRTLNERGHSDAPAMAKRLVEKKINIDLFVSSTAVRALTTATYFAKAYNQSAEHIFKVKELYHAAPAIFYKVVSEIDNKYNSVALFSHNPGITEFVNELTQTRIIDMPTCGIFAIKFSADNWQNFDTTKKDFWFFDYPKSM